MVTRFAEYSPSSATVSKGTSQVNFGIDLTQTRAFLSGTVLPSRSFAEAMLVLGRVVSQDLLPPVRDHSAYQRWVQEQYMQELERRLGETRLGALETEARLRREVNELRDRLRRIPETEELIDARDRYWDWLYDNNRGAWVVLDPIVSVAHDATFFEAFSKDESTYVRVRLPHRRIEMRSDPQRGTTNIDFGVGLERELARVRSYRPLDLTVGGSGVTVSTSARSAFQRKIDLPDSWVQGLLEVQSSLSLATVDLQVSATFVADIWAFLEGHREKHGPRSLRFELVPGEPVSVVVEPWNLMMTDTGSTHTATVHRTVRVWGRRRLEVLAPLLPRAETVTISLLDDGMPSFWTTSIDGITTTLALSGWTRMNWSGKARFAGLRPRSAATDELVQRVRDLLVNHHALTAEEAQDLLAETSLAPVLGALQTLCARGEAMFVLPDRTFRRRLLFQGLDTAPLLEPGYEETAAGDLIEEGSVRSSQDGARLEGSFGGETTVLQLDEDQQITNATCSCDRYRFHQLRQGPCRHMIATLMRRAGRG